MKDKGILCLHYEDKHRKLNYVIRNGKICVITGKASNKVTYIKKHQSVVIEFEDGHLHTVTPQFLTHNDQIKDLFEYMTDLENNHFKTFQDAFLGIEFNM